MSSKEITSRATDYSQWYLDVIEAADLAEHAPVRGCMIIKPYGYAIWENIQSPLNSMIKESGAENAYFPLLIPEKFLTKEAEHVEGFAPECAVVTHAGGKKLEEAYVIRPTSETIIYDAFSRWISSYRDLPLIINQWANVMRWELRPRLFLRTTEFLWQEGHTAHATEEEAEERTRQMLGVYEQLARDYLALPVITGVKSDSEKFAGAVRTYTLEAMMQDGKALQAGTSHMLGQNFAKAFDVTFQDVDEVVKHAWQTSWGVSTRLIGALIMGHSDDKGLVLPPKLAPIQAVIIPVWRTEEEAVAVMAKAKEIESDLKKVNIRVKLDQRDLRIGQRIFEWEKKGVPVRIEIGPRDLAAGTLAVARRDTGEKESVAIGDSAKHVQKLLIDIHQNLYDRSLALQKSRTRNIDSWDDLVSYMAKDEGFALAHWCGNAVCEEKVKTETKSTIRCIPFAQPEEKGVCVVCGQPSLDKRIVFAKSY